ncbi:DUF2512 family protein [Oceanobacillus halophilus]|uniref:DUF2512 family protein n=2 Tax=Oceanobacillus halophilus TaxID=930130 RepID=A0A494ZTV4_9BACI|nr:DUF2512 family protein [Oceanobacillus halophilus]
MESYMLSIKVDKISENRKEKKMRYLFALIVKFVMLTAILWIVLGIFYGINLGDIFTISILLSVVSFVGDVFLLPRIGNVLAVIGDFALSFLVIWGLGNSLFAFEIPVVTAAFISALFVGVGEIFYHRYMKNQVFAGLEKDFMQTHHMQTEYSEEFSPEDKK